MPTPRAASFSPPPPTAQPPTAQPPTARRRAARLGAATCAFTACIALASGGTGAGLPGTGAGGPFGPAAAHADPAPVAAHVTDVRRTGPQILEVDVYSPSMDRVITNTVLRPPGGGPAPVLYLLNGIRGGTADVSWAKSTDYEQFFADKNVNVVTPIGGPFSEYTDWRFDDPALGPAQGNQWQTYLTRELPPVIDAEFAGTGRNAIAGLSMSAGPAVDLAIAAPDLYDAVGSYSGCPINGGPFGAAQVSSVVLAGGGSASNMWGLPGSGDWARHDQFARAAELQGTAVYLGSASGIPGEVDALKPSQMFGAVTGGGPVEAVADHCTAAYSQRLDAVGVPHTFVHRDRGAHTWGLFESEMEDSWHRVIGPALGA